MTPAGDRPEIAPADEEAWLDQESPAYRAFVDAIDVNDTRPGVPAEEVRQWVESLGSDRESPKPRAR